MLNRLETALTGMEEPSAFFEALRTQERAELTELYDLIGVPQSPKYHPEGDAFVHTMMVIDEAAALRGCAKQPFPFMLAALTHDLGKKISTGRKENGDWHSIGHERTGKALIGKMLSRLGVQEETIAYCVSLCSLHMRVHTCFMETRALQRRTACLANVFVLRIWRSCAYATPGERADRRTERKRKNSSSGSVLRST